MTTPTPDLRRYAPAAGRNRDAILAELRGRLPAEGLILEIASGSGEHAAHLARAMPRLAFQPSDPDAEALASIDAWAVGLPNILPAVALDATAARWPVGEAAAVLCINLLHIAPWAAAVGLVRGAARVLQDGGPLLVYGPFRRGGRHTAPSNAEFDADLRARDPAWGVRDAEAVAGLAAATGFGQTETVAMPANNLLLVWRRLPHRPRAFSP